MAFGTAARGLARALPGNIGGGAHSMISPHDYGMNTNPDGTVSVYHHTSPTSAQRIIEEKRLLSSGEPDVYFTTEREPITGYGSSVVRVDVDPRHLILDDEFPSGRYDFRAEAPSGEFPLREAVAEKFNDAPPQLPDPTNPMANPNFRRWFGESKVVDEAGNPLRVFHGTGASFSRFDPRKRGSASHQPDAREGYFLTSNPSVADTYAESSVYENIRAQPNVVPAFVGMQSPLDITAGSSSVENAIRRAKLEGRDGVILRGDRDGGDIGDTFITFDPTQIKSVFNRGTFDPNDPNILHMTPQAQQPAATTREPYWVRMARERARQGLLERAMQDENEREAR